MNQASSKRLGLRLAVGILLLPLAGCRSGCGTGLPPPVPLSGTVTMNGQPLAGALVIFTPAGATRGIGSMGRTTAAGVYTLEASGGKERGAVAGQYKVVISRRVLPDGSVLPANSPVGPMDSPARETLPPRYSDPEKTTLTAVVPEGGGTIDFPLNGDKK